MFWRRKKAKGPNTKIKIWCYRPKGESSWAAVGEQADFRFLEHEDGDEYDIKRITITVAEYSKMREHEGW